MKPGEVGNPPTEKGPEPWDVGGTVVGVRAWTLFAYGGKFRLGGFGNPAWGAMWERGVVEATCLKPSLHPGAGYEAHAAPARGCHCGVNAFWTRMDLVEQEPTAFLHGYVEAWGTVVPGQLGFRASRAMITALEVPECRRNLCDAPADVVHAQPRWGGQFRGNGARVSRETLPWSVNRGDAYCEEHVPEPWAAANGKCRSYGCRRVARERGQCLEHVPFELRVDELLGRLADWYECDVLPFVPGDLWDAMLPE